MDIYQTVKQCGGFAALGILLGTGAVWINVLLIPI
jgi:hypothetical protein